MEQKEKILDELSDQLNRCVSAFSKKISKISSSQQLGNSNSDFFTYFKNSLLNKSSLESKSKNDISGDKNINLSTISLALKFIEQEMNELYLIGIDCGYSEKELIDYYAQSSFNVQITKTVTMFFYSLMQESKLQDVVQHQDLILKSFLSILDKYDLNREEVIKEVCLLGANKFALSLKNVFPLFMAMTKFNTSHDSLYKNILSVGATSDKENGSILKSLYDLGVRFNLSDNFLLKNTITFEQLPTILYQSDVTNKTKLFLKTTQYHYTNESAASPQQEKIEYLKNAIDYVDSLLMHESLEDTIPQTSPNLKTSPKKEKNKTAKL